MPVSSFQADVLAVIAPNRNPNSFVAGAIVINRFGARYSGDIDIFQDFGVQLSEVAQRDAADLVAAGYQVEWRRSGEGMTNKAQVLKGGQHTEIDWVTDSEFRFFPAIPDNLFGFALHPVDLATNKAAAAFDRRVPRDIYDLVHIHEEVLPLGACVTAAVGRFPGPSPEGMLNDIARHSRFSPLDFQALELTAPIEVGAFHERTRAMLELARAFVATIPSSAVGAVYIADGQAVQPDPARLTTYYRHEGTRGGSWPSDSAVTARMMSRLGLA